MRLDDSDGESWCLWQLAGKPLSSFPHEKLENMRYYYIIWETILQACTLIQQTSLHCPTPKLELPDSLTSKIESHFGQPRAKRSLQNSNIPRRFRRQNNGSSNSNMGEAINDITDLLVSAELRFDAFVSQYSKDKNRYLRVYIDPRFVRKTEVIYHRPFWPFQADLLDVEVCPLTVE